MRIRPARPWSGRTLLTAALAGALVMAACGDDDDDDGAAATTAPAETASEPGSIAPGTAPPTDGSAPDTTAGGDEGGDEGGDSQEVVVGAVLEPTSLDIVTVAGAAIDQVLLDNVYETLLTYSDEAGELGPGLAELPDVSEDETVYTFTLVDGPTFHSGEPLTAADVVWSLDAQRADGANESARLASIASVEAPDDRTVVVTLSEPDNDLLFRLTRRAGAVLQADAADLANGANGTGPFTFEEWNVGSSITLARNDNYWGTVPSISGVALVYFTDPNAAVNALTTEDVDILTGVNPDLVGQFEDDPAYVVTEGSSNGEFTLAMNNRREPFSNPDVRRAVRQAIDKEGYLELLNGYGTIIGAPVPPTDPWYEDLTGVVPYDPEAARAAIEGAGYGDGLDVTLLWPNFYPTSNAEYVASQLADVGINVEIQTVEFAVWLEQVFGNKDYEMTAVLHAEPRDIGNYANPDYYWQYDSADVQQLISDAKTTTDDAEAVELLKRAARQIAEDSPNDWLILGADIVVSRPDVTGYPTEDTASRFDASGIMMG